MDGYEVCRRIREQADTAYLPVVMVTASGDEQKVKALEAGADDFLTKPVNQSELLARVASLARIKRYQDTIKRQADELTAWNRELESRVETQVAQLDRMSGLRRFLSPQLAELIVDSGDESFLESHRREIVVVFCDMRGFTAFAESSEPEEIMGVLTEYHEALGDLIFRFEGTLERFTGDGLMVFFNDPVRCDDGALRAIRMGLAMRTRVRGLAEGWARQGHDLAMSVGDLAGLRDAGQDRLRRQVRLRRDRERHQRGRPAVRHRRAVADPGDRAGVLGGRVARRRRGRGDTRAEGPQPRCPHVQRQGRGQLADRVVTGDLWTPPYAGPDVLSALSEEDRYQRFDALQARMAGVWEAMRLNHDDESVVVLPSISLDRATAASGSMTQAMEERFLFLLMLLRQPRLRMVYVTSMPIASEIIEYYLALLPGVIPSHARARLSLVAVHDSSPGR